MKGSVLIVSLWAVGFLTSVTVAQATRVGLQARLVGREQELAQAANLARTGVAYALWQLDADAQRSWDARAEAWAQPARWAPAFPEDQDGWTVAIEDAEGTLNLNALLATWSDDALDQIPRRAGVDLPGFGAQLRRAVTQDGTTKPLIHLEELVARAGIPHEVIPKLQALVRVAGAATVNLNATGPTVLELLGLPEPLAQRLVQLRDRQADRADDDWIYVKPEGGSEPLMIQPGTGGMPVALGTLPEFQGDDLTLLFTAVGEGRLGVASTTFRVRAEGVTRAHQLRRTVEALVTRPADGAPSTVARWHET